MPDDEPEMNHHLATVLRHLHPTRSASIGGDGLPVDQLRVGVIGLDGDGATVTRLLNTTNGDIGCHVVAAYDRGIYPRGSSVHSSVPHGQHGTIRNLVELVPAATREVEALGVPLVDTIGELLGMVHVVFLMTRDGRPRLEQAAEVLRSRKPLFMDRPVASNLADALVILTLAAGLGVPCCSASPLRWAEGCRAARAGSLGTVVHADTYSPTGIDQEAIDAGHLELCWDATHGVDMLFAVMGAGCTSVTYRCSVDGSDGVYEGLWDKDAQAGSRTGTYHNLDEYGGTTVTEDGRVHALVEFSET
eukprot:COSAG02_NODE_8657_length_2488_cov_24.884889_1_plen_303_part_10